LETNTNKQKHRISAGLVSAIADLIGSYATRRLAADSAGLSIRGVNEPAPILLSAKALQTVVAELYFKVSEKVLQLEGASLDRNGNLRFPRKSQRHAGF
jgi:hypothetical protein